LFEKILDLYGEFRIQCDAGYRGRVPPCMVEEQRAKKLQEQISKILTGFEEL